MVERYLVEAESGLNLRGALDRNKFWLPRGISWSELWLWWNKLDQTTRVPVCCVG